jgi:two-component system, OmpR family, response regulator
MARVLLVEDDHDIREVVRIVLTEEGHIVTTAVDGAQALSLLTDSAEPFVALVDYHMPQLTGWRVLQNVAARPEVAARHAFIFMTGDLRALANLAEDLSGSGSGSGCGVLETLTKPFDLETLTAMVRQAAARLAAHPPC